MYFEPHGLDDPPPRWLKDWKGDGILARVNDRRMTEAVRATGLPAVDLRGRLPDLGLPFIGVNNAAVAELAIQHLLGQGFRQFTFCGLPAGEHIHMDERRAHFTRLVGEKGYPCRVFELSRGNCSWEQQQEEMADWVRRLPQPIGCMTCNDDRGRQLLDACRRVGVAVPDAVAVVSVDNDPILCGLAMPALSSIDVNAPRIGFAAARLLDRMMAGDAPPDRPLLTEPSAVVARQSTDVLAVEDRDIAAAVRLIREQACNGIGVEDLLEALPLARSTLERRFRKFLGRTPKEEIVRVRIERAKFLLAETDQPLRVVGQKSGFQSYKYFGDAFYRQTGIRPGAFRTRFGQGAGGSATG